MRVALPWLCHCFATQPRRLRGGSRGQSRLGADDYSKLPRTGCRKSQRPVPCYRSGQHPAHREDSTQRQKQAGAAGSQGQMSCSDAVRPRRPPIDTPLHTTPRLLSCKPALHVYAKKRARPDSKQGRPSGRSVTTAWRSATKSVEGSPLTLGKGSGGVQAANLRKAPKGETQTRRILPPRCRLSVVVECIKRSIT